MRLAVSMYSYARPFRAGEMDIPGFIREACAIGVEGVELLAPFYRNPDRDREAAKAALEETGLPCPIFSVSQNFAKSDPDDRRSELEKIKFGIAEAIWFGSDIVRVFAGDVSSGITFDDARRWILEGLTEASLFAAEHGKKLALENHGKLAGRGDQVRDLIEEVRGLSQTTALGANPDTGNFLLVDQPSHEAIAQVADLAAMVHFKDFVPCPPDHSGFAYESLKGDRFVGAVVGEGIVHLSECRDALVQGGFDGWFSIEYEGEEDPATAAPRCVLNAKRVLNL